MRAADLGTSGRRIRVAAVGLAAAFALLAARAVQLSVWEERGARRGAAQTHAVLRVSAARGAIRDRSGAPLALSVDAPSVYASPERVRDAGAAARALARILEPGAAELREGLRSDTPFVFLRRWVSEEAAESVRALGLPGVGIVEEPRRAYPNDALAGRLLGFADIDGEGVRGIEQMEDAWLRGHARRFGVERDARRRVLARPGADPRRAAGGDVRLTLDAALQAEVGDALAETVEATGAKGGLALLLDPRRGDLLAHAEAPAFDPNEFRETPYRATRARAFLDAVEPGSTLKPFAVAAALESGALEADAVVDTGEGRLRVPGKTLRDREPFGRLGLGELLRVSSNIGAAKVAFEAGRRAHHAVLERLGFGRPTGSGFPDESAGLLRPWRDWRPLDQATIAFGQGVNGTAVQVAAALGAVADEGRWRPPRLVAARRPPGGDWQPEPVPEGRQALHPRVARRLRRWLGGVVSPEGTGRRAALRGVPVAGKTGTAQKLDPETGRYSEDRYLAWFAGMAPADDPRLVAVVMLDEPAGRLRSGGTTAAPLFARVVSAHLARHGTVTAPEHALPRLARADAGAPEPSAPAPPPQRTARTQAPEPGAEPASARAARPPSGSLTRLGDRVLLPDFRGLSKEEVKRITSASALRVEIRGEGLAIGQEPAPGTVVAARRGRVRVRFARPAEGG